MEKKEMVSIIVPMHNAAPYIQETIQSVIKQTWKNWELLLVDDCSEDNTVDVVREACGKLEQPQQDRIKVIELADNIGAAETRNTGLKAATGRYIAYLDADDFWQPEKLEKQLALMLEKQAAFSFTGYEFADENGRGLGKIVRVPDTLVYKQALQNTTIFTSTVMFDTEKIAKEQLTMPQIKSEDTALWFRILRMGYTAYGLNENLVMYRRPAKSLSSNKLEALRRIWNLYRKSEYLSLPYSVYNFCFWALRAVKRRI